MLPVVLVRHLPYLRSAHSMYLRCNLQCRVARMGSSSQLGLHRRLVESVFFWKVLSPYDHKLCSTMVKKKKDASEPQKGLGSPLAIVIAIVIALIALGVAFRPTTSGSAELSPQAVKQIAKTIRLNKQLALLDACADACAQNIDIEDSNASLDLDPDADEFDAIDMCIYRCRNKEKKRGEVAYIENPSPKPSKVVQDYHECAIRCSSGSSLDPSEDAGAVLHRLASCGVVHLRNAVPSSLIKEAGTAMEQLRQGGFEGNELKDFLSVGTLRAGREEIWLPFVRPFAEAELLEGLASSLSLT